jgi:hypothetical protein
MDLEGLLPRHVNAKLFVLKTKVAEMEQELRRRHKKEVELDEKWKATHE